MKGRLILLLSLLGLLAPLPAVAQLSGDSARTTSPRLIVTSGGTITLSVGQTTIWEDNPLLPQAYRKRTVPLLEHQGNLHTSVRYGDRLSLDLDYNTDRGLSSSKNRLRLGYKGAEYELLQSLQAGNISYRSHNPLISMPSNLFGVTGDLWLGPLQLRFLTSIQRDNVRRMSVRRGRQVYPFELKSSDYEANKHFFLSEYFAQKYDAALRKLPLVSSEIKILRVAVWMESDNTSDNGGLVSRVTAYSTLSKEGEAPPEGQGAGEGVEIPYAVRLDEDDYEVNRLLGFISLKFPIADAKRLAVAYEYQYQGRIIRVGSFDADASGTITAALLVDRDKSPTSELWPLMMKNGYSIGGSGGLTGPEDLEVKLSYVEPSTGVPTEMTPSGESWMRWMGWDLQDSRGVGGVSDGRFDYHPGVTVSEEMGTIFLPRREPFRSLPPGYEPYESLYKESRTRARERQDLDLFRITGAVSSRSGGMVRIGHRVPKGSITAVQGGRTLVEGSDYQVDYDQGELTILSSSEEPVELSIPVESQTEIKRRSLFGIEAELMPISHLTLGTSLYGYIEDSGDEKMSIRQEDLRNTILGAHLTYDHSSTSLSRRLARISQTSPDLPSSLRIRMAYAHLISDYNTSGGSGQIVVDDFEDGGSAVDLTSPLRWQLSTCRESDADHRAHLAWFSVDPLLVRDGAPGQPTGLARRQDMRRHPLVREYRVEELFPRRDLNQLGTQFVRMLNLSYYPDERGPFNYRTEGWVEGAKLSRATDNWAAIATPLEVHDLEKEHITSLELWLLDPYYSGQDVPEGDLLIDLGRFSEEIIPDGALDFESSLPTVTTPHGRRAETVPPVRAFSSDGMERQDVGLDGVSSREEQELFPDYLRSLTSILDPMAWTKGGVTLPGSPLEDPSGDDYHFYLGEQWDRAEAGILERYKYINGTEGNSLPRLIQGHPSAWTDLPDTEDLDGDGVLTTRESFFRYHLRLSREGLQPGGKWYTGESVVQEESGQSSRWVKLTIPLSRYDAAVGIHPAMQDISSVRLTLRHFEQPIHLRCAAIRLVSSPWQPYTSTIDDGRTNAEITLQTHSLEEDSGRSPIPYVSPKGVARDRRSRALSQVRYDERALAISIPDMARDEVSAVYRSTDLDLRHYRQLVLYSHAEGGVRDRDLELFIRLGSDFSSNYYEYCQPLLVTPQRDYRGMSSGELQDIVWPSSNVLRIDLDELIGLKEERESYGGVDRSQVFTRGRVSLRGYPSLGNVTAILIGVRNKSSGRISAEVWVNELSVSGAGEMSGGAWLTDVSATLSDFGSASLKVGRQSAGYGDIRSDVRLQQPLSHAYFDLESMIELGKLLPGRWGVQAPVRYTVQESRRTPHYDPYDTDRPYRGDEPIYYEHADRLSLSNWRVRPERESRRSKSDLTLSYDLEHHRRRDPQTLDRSSRRMHSTIDYLSESGTGDYIRLHSGWDRVYDSSLLPTPGEEMEHSPQVYHNWLWDRSLGIKWSPVTFGSVTIHSNTLALVDDTPSSIDHRDRDLPFRLFSEQILRSIAALGATDRYQSRYTLSLHTPPMRPRLLRPAYLSLTYSGDYSWRRGVIVGEESSGHTIRNDGRLDLLMRYNLGQSADSRKSLGEVQVKYGRYGGSTIPGFLPEAGKVFGVGHQGRAISPTLGYMLGISDFAEEINHAVRSKWVKEDPTLSRLPSYFVKDDLACDLRLRPLTGVTIDLFLSQVRSRSYICSGDSGEGKEMTGRLRMSTIGLRRDATAEILRDLAGDTDRDRVLGLFRSNYLVSPKEQKGLPSPLNLLPNWLITLDLASLSDAIRSVTPRLVVKHQYQGLLELPDYRLRSDAAPESPYDLQTITTSDHFGPLIGVDATVGKGLTLSAAYVLSNSRSLMVESLRLLTQSDRRGDLSLRHQLSLPPLISSGIPILSSSRTSLESNLSYSYTHTSLEEASIRSGSRSRLRGLDSHSLRLTLDYHCSNSLSLRGFWREEIRNPLVTGHQYPYRKSSYGVMLMLSLRP